MKILKAIYDFVVGDMVILAGVLIACCILTAIHTINVLEPLRAYSGAILIIAVLVVLVTSLYRETR